MHALAAAGFVAMSLVYAGCEWGDAGPPSPAPVPSPSGSTTGDGGLSQLPDAATAIRTVSWRGPLGTVPDNLFVDGDFEFSAYWPGGQPQTGWFAFNESGSSLSYMRFETGGICRTGLRCAVLPTRTIFFGNGTSAVGSGMRAEIWARIPEGRSCDVVEAYLLSCDTWGTIDQLQASPLNPDADGWCRYEAAVTERSTGTCMYVASTLALNETALIDSATLLPEVSVTPVAAARPVDPAVLDRARAIVDWIRRNRIVGRPLEAPRRATVP